MDTPIANDRAALEITNIMLIHAHLKVGPPCGHRFSSKGCGPMRQCVNASMGHFNVFYIFLFTLF